MSSSRLVNYSLRPAKAVERKMLCDLFRRLEPFGRAETYRYIGFGAIYFSDFQLFHQMLGISDMISIEKDERNASRFAFNTPFRCVDFRPGHSNVILPRLEWAKRSIVWLDYDGRLDREVLADIGTFGTKALSGSIILITINVEPDRNDPRLTPDQQSAARLNSFVEAVGEDKVPIGITGADLRGTGYGSVCLRVVQNEIQTILSNRSGPLPEEKKLLYRQLINLTYADDAQMLTVGGLIYENQDTYLVDKCAFAEVPFVNSQETPTSLRAPKFTLKELRELNAKLPETATQKANLPGIPETDVTEYAKIYRYYPSFGEVLLG